MSHLRYNEQSNVADSLRKAADFLSQGDYKWFILAFHHGMHHLMLIYLHRRNAFLIWEPRKKNGELELTRDGLPKTFSKKNRLIGPTTAFEKCYAFISPNTSISQDFTMRMIEPLFKRLNDQMRNPFTHFPPMGWGLSFEHIREICSPLSKFGQFLILDIDAIGVPPEIATEIKRDLERTARELDKLLVPPKAL